MMFFGCYHSPCSESELAIVNQDNKQSGGNIES
jgi:hypothetical protein